MPNPRIVVAYSDVEHPGTTGSYCLRALQEIADVTHVRGEELSNLCADDADLFLRIDDDRRWHWPERLQPSCYWAIDTHLDYHSRLEQARRFEAVFCAQKAGAARMCVDGVTAIWMPLACDPLLHGKQDVERKYDLCTVGHFLPGHARSDLAALLEAHFPNSFFGQRPFTELGLAYSEAHLAFNHSLNGDLNMRVFEAICSGTLLLTNALEDLEELFQDGTHLSTYRSPGELVEKARYYLDNPEERESIATAGREEALQKHTYRHRMLQVLDHFHLAPGKKPKKKVRGATGPAIRIDTPAPLEEAPAAPAVVSGEPLVICTPGNPGHAPPEYFEWSRPDVLARIPENVMRVLDIGCGAGALGEAIKTRSAAAGFATPCVAGIEIDTEAAERAAGRLDVVLVGDAEELIPDPKALLARLLPSETDPQNTTDEEQPAKRPRQKKTRTAVAEAPIRTSFDCIILADCLEHLREPEEFLRLLRPLLSKDGALVLSVPNVRHREVFQALAQGRWAYEAAGLLDRGHLRFFTRRDLEQTLFRAGYDVFEIGGMVTPDHARWAQLGRPGNLEFGPVALQALRPEDAEEFFTYQWLLSARPRPECARGLTSIIILTRNGLEFTRDCVESIYRHTHEPFELIFVDNGSSDGTVDYLKSLPGVTIICNRENLGFPRGCNQGIARARGQNVLLLNNDTLASEGWLTRLLDALYSAPDVGAVGPRSHGISGPQWLEGPAPALEQVDTFAWDMGRVHNGRRFALNMVVGCCLLTKKALLDEIGPLDERFGIGLFEDNDLSRRLRVAGCRLLCACDAYIYHHGSRTFHAEQINVPEQYGMAEAEYFAKWGTEEEPNPIPPDFRMPEDPVEIPPLPAKPRISLCMIARNEAHNIGPCLDSIRKAVDEIIVVDTGSTDRTAEIAAEHGARVERFEWCDDFSAAPNASLSYATGDWILWMDCDDRMPAEHLPLIRKLASPESPEIGGYLFTCQCPGVDGTDEETMVHHLRMFRRHDTIRFEHRLHEQALPAVRRAGLQVQFAPVEIIHEGYDWTEAGQILKRERDLRILTLELLDYPNHPFSHYNMGMTMNSLGRWDEAIYHLQRSIQLSYASESHLRKASGLLVNAYLHRHGPEPALLVALDGLQLFPDDPELLFRAGDLFRLLNEKQRARECYELLLERREGLHCTSVETGILSYRTRHALALTLRDLGENDRCELELRRCLAERPGFLPAWIALAELLVDSHKTPEAGDVIKRIRAAAPDLPEGLRLKGEWILQTGNHEAAKQSFTHAIALNPADLRARRLLTSLLLHERRLEEAERQLLAVLALDPGDASCRHNLATLYHETGRLEEALEQYRDALALRPEDANTHLGLGMALKSAQNPQAAIHHLSQAIRLAPQHPGALYELGDLLLSLGDLQQARRCFQELLRIDPTNAAARSALAVLDSQASRRR